jgi:hypothetical protein
MVFLLREMPEMTEWLLPVALRVHCQSLIRCFLRVRKPEVIPIFHFDPIPDVESLFLLLPGEVPDIDLQLFRAMLNSRGK